MTIFASGSEVEIALAARTLLEGDGHPTRVVSVPCFELFEQQSADYRTAMIGTAPVRVAIEAGIRQGWDHFIGTDGIFVGMTGFGASAHDRATLPAFRHHRRSCGEGRHGAPVEVEARPEPRRGNGRWPLSAG